MGEENLTHLAYSVPVRDKIWVCRAVEHRIPGPSWHRPGRRERPCQPTSPERLLPASDEAARHVVDFPGVPPLPAMPGFKA
jgi:hypothetical protein